MTVTLPHVYIETSAHGDNVVTATVSVDNRAKLNVLNSKLLDEFAKSVESHRKVKDVRALIVRGVGGKAFIGGADIRELQTLDPSTARVFIRKVHGVCQAIRNCDVPTIACIDGFCLGAGMEIAAACDLRVATAKSMFGMPEVKVGVPSVVEAALLPTLIGWGRTRELLLLGEMIDAKTAYEWGFVERIARADNLDDTVDKLVASIATCGPNAVRLQKELIRKWEKLPLPDAIETGVEAFGEAYKTDEPKEYTAKFLNR